MNKTFFHVAFLACLASTGCASPMSLFAKKPQSFDDYRTEQIAKNQARVPSSNALSRGAGDTAELLTKGHTAFQQGLMNEAQANYQAVLRKQPNHAEANHRLAVIADRQNDFATAERYYQAAVAAAPRDPNILNDLGYSYLLQSRYAEAERYLTTALQQSPNQANAINNLGILHAKIGQPDQALAMFRRTNSEAEAQAKLARFMPPNLNAAAQPNTLVANNPQWPNNGVPPTNPLPAQPQMRQPLNPNTAYAQPPNNLPTATNNDPTISETARQLKDAMERERQRSVAERQARDQGERQRQDQLLRQLREDELGRSAVTQAGGPQTGGGYRGSQIPNNTPNGPIVIGPPQGGFNPQPQSNIKALPTSQPGLAPRYAPRTGLPEGFPAAPQRPSDTYPNPNSNLPPNNSQLWNVPNPPQQLPPNSIPNPNATRGINNSPLDAMPAWPQTNPLPAVNSNAGLPNGSMPNMSDEAARAASRMGMNAGPGNLFPIAPGPSANVPGYNAAPNRAALPNQFAPQPPANWQNHPDNGEQFQAPPNAYGPNANDPNAGNFNRQPSGPATGQPPAGTFGDGGYETSANSLTIPESPTRFALQDRLPPSEQYQTPSNFNAFGTPNSIPAQSSSFMPNRGLPNQNPNPQSLSTRDLIAEMERASTRTNPDRAGGDDRWEQGSAPNGLSSAASAPTMQGFLATPAGDNALAEYERMNQMHNSEMNMIRQQLDSQRQLPGSENYFRSSTQSQLGTPTGADPNLGRIGSSRRSNFNPMPSNNAPRQLP